MSQLHNPRIFDCHNHILPGLDDGAQTLEESLFLAGKLVEYGYRRCVCTPHSSYLYRNTPLIVQGAVEQLRAALAEKNIPLEISGSMEYRLIPETWTEVRQNGWLMPWEGNHILVELPLRTRDRMGALSAEGEIRKLVADGYQPVLAHPERYLYLAQDEYDALFAAGAVFQRNLGSMEGFYGDASARRAKWLEERGYYAFVGTDLHNQEYADYFDRLFAERDSRHKSK